mmetsp:Transcript_128045/g.410308  ORF Transcript_128045/g.410308 Transcript_128045/m.410308 type:complete len:253 (+) Transcript_128045:2197-2955(+)
MGGACVLQLRRSPQRLLPRSLRRRREGCRGGSALRRGRAKGAVVAGVAAVRHRGPAGLGAKGASTFSAQARPALRRHHRLDPKLHTLAAAGPAAHALGPAPARAGRHGRARGPGRRLESGPHGHRRLQILPQLRGFCPRALRADLPLPRLEPEAEQLHEPSSADQLGRGTRGPGSLELLPALPRQGWGAAARAHLPLAGDCLACAGKLSRARAERSEPHRRRHGLVAGLRRLRERPQLARPPSGAAKRRPRG